MYFGRFGCGFIVITSYQEVDLQNKHHQLNINTDDYEHTNIPVQQRPTVLTRITQSHPHVQRIRCAYGRHDWIVSCSFWQFGSPTAFIIVRCRAASIWPSQQWPHRVDISRPRPCPHRTSNNGCMPWRWWLVCRAECRPSFDIRFGYTTMNGV